MKKIAVIIAGGIGVRMGHDIPKQFITVEKKPIIIYTLEAFQKHPEIDSIVTVCVAGWQEILRTYAKQYNISKLESIVTGGRNGQESIKNGINEVKNLGYDDNDIVLIHDAIRPMVSDDIISDNIVKCAQYGNATAVAPCTTVVLGKTTEEYSTEVVDREKLYLTQTPQAFKLGEILDAHKEAQERGLTDAVASCSLFVELGRKVYYSYGSETNIKLTRPGDIEIFNALLKVQKSGDKK